MEKKTISKIGKILLILAAIVTIFSGLNNLFIVTENPSLIRLISDNIPLTMKIIYILTGVCSLIVSVILGIKTIRD